MNDVDVRITSSPVEGGEAVSLRLFSRGNLVRQLTGLGLSELDLVKVDRILPQWRRNRAGHRPYWFGKTTTVYTMLAELNGDSRNIVSIEDPVEYQVPSYANWPLMSGTTCR